VHEYLVQRQRHGNAHNCMLTGQRTRKVGQRNPQLEFTAKAQVPQHELALGIALTHGANSPRNDVILALIRDDLPQRYRNDNEYEHVREQ